MTTPDNPDSLVCDVPGCDRVAATTFIARENGVLAGREWKINDQLRFCWPHANDVYHDRDPSTPENVASPGYPSVTEEP